MIILYLCEAVFCLFSIHFVIRPITLKKSFQNFGCLYLGQKTTGEATFASLVGPRPNNSPLQRGDASKAKQPILCRKKIV